MSDHLRFWPALAAGLLLAGLGVWFWIGSSHAVFNSQLLQKLPKDSSVAGAARLSRFSPDTVAAVSKSAQLDPAGGMRLANLLSAAGVSQRDLTTALDDQFSFARTSRGDLAIFTVAKESAFADIQRRLAAHSTGTNTATLQTNAGTLTVWQGVPTAGSPVVSVYRSGREVYVSTNPSLIAAASREGNGFTSLDRFTEVSKQLPPGADAYVFVNIAQAKEPPVAFPLTGVAVTNAKDRLGLAIRVAEPPVVSKTVPNTNGRLLPGPDAAAAAIEGTNAGRYLQLLEEQRQESDLPRVITLQNGIASLDRKLGVDLERDYLDRAAGHFVYGRYRDAAKTNQWFAALQFDSTQTATTKVGELTKLLRERVTVPTRHEVVRTLPDGTQSREIVSQGNEPLAISDVMIEGHGGNAATFPDLGAVNWVTDGEYLVLGSSPEAAARMIRTIASPTVKLDERGELAVRATVSQVRGLLGSRDGLFNWILATQPESGSLTLTKSTGELEGVVRFKQAGR